MTYCPRQSTSEPSREEQARAGAREEQARAGAREEQARAGAREEQARALCLRLLTARARTRAELAGQLTKRGYPDDVSTRVLDRLAEVGLVDDADFAEQWVRSRRVNVGKGKRALAAELRTRGVDNEVITAALAGIDAGAERQRAEQMVQAKLRRENLDRDETKVARRLVAMLARRGYSETMAFDVVTTEMGLELERRRT